MMVDRRTLHDTPVMRYRAISQRRGTVVTFWEDEREWVIVEGFGLVWSEPHVSVWQRPA